MFWFIVGIFVWNCLQGGVCVWVVASWTCSVSYGRSRHITACVLALMVHRRLDTVSKWWDEDRWQIISLKPAASLVQTIIKNKIIPKPCGPKGWCWSSFPWPSSRHQLISCVARPWRRGWCIAWSACLCPIFHWYQVTLLGDRGTWVWTTCQRLLLDSVVSGAWASDHWVTS